MSRVPHLDARLAAADAALAAAMRELAYLEGVRTDRERALAMVDGLPTLVRVAAPAQIHVDEVARDVTAIGKRVAVARDRVIMFERERVAAEMERIAAVERERQPDPAAAISVVLAVDPAPLETRNMRRYLGGSRRGSRAKVVVAVARSTRWLDVAELFLAPRIAREEIGDLLEIIHRFEREGRPAWHIYVRAVTGVFFAIWHSWGEKIASLKKIGG